MSREEDHVCRALSDLCRNMNIKCLVQVGAEDGYEAWWIADDLKCRAVAIEGDTQCSPCSPKIEYHHAVIGSSDGFVDFHSHSTAGLSSLIARKDGHETVRKEWQHRLDSFCTARGIVPDALIIDTEGTSLDVLEGAGKLLDGVKVIYAEVQNHAIRPGIRLLPEVETFLSARGFTRRDGPPSYSEKEAQGNLTWVKP